MLKDVKEIEFLNKINSQPNEEQKREEFLNGMKSMKEMFENFIGNQEIKEKNRKNGFRQ